MSYNPFDYIGTDKRKSVSSQAMSIAKAELSEYALKEIVRKIVRKKLWSRK